MHKLDKQITEIFTGKCKLEKHSLDLNFFCQNHNELCCAACISKIQNNEYGQHKHCDIYEIGEIKEEKEKNLKQNIQYLEKISSNLNDSINELKTIYDKMNKKKEELKTKIIKIFTKIRSALNEREDELLLQIDEKFKDLFFGEEILKQSEKLPNQVKTNLEKGKEIENKWNDDKELKSIINDCIKIENNIVTINKINNNINKCNSTEIETHIEPEEKGIEDYISEIKKFGNLNFLWFNRDIISQCYTNILAFSIEANIPLNSGGIKQDNNAVNEIKNKAKFDPKKKEERKKRRKKSY